jgi:hypothetical protein
MKLAADTVRKLFVYDPHTGIYKITESAKSSRKQKQRQRFQGCFVFSINYKATMAIDNIGKWTIHSSRSL